MRGAATMFDGLDRLKMWLQSGDQFFQQIHALWNNGPRVDVYEHGDKVKVVIEAPGLMNAASKNQWAVKVSEQNLFLRGRLHMQQSVRSDPGRTYSERREEEQFMKIIPLPAPVHQKPTSVRYDDGLVTILFEKRRDAVEEIWQPIDFTRKK
jgi:HSP20 family molecular chaperone IbpA